MLRISRAGVVGLIGLVWVVSGAFAQNPECFDYGAMNPIVALCAPGFDSGEFIVDGNLVYVLREYPAGLVVLDISEPSTPREIGSLPEPDLLFNLRRDGDHLYATGYGTLSIIDISEPTAPALVGSLSDARMSDIYDIAVSGGLVCIANGWQSFLVVDAVNPAAPLIAGELTFSRQYVESVAVAGSQAYLGIRDTGMYVVDVSDPTSPQLVPPLYVNGRADQIEVQGGLVWVGDDLYGNLTAWDMSRPEGPAILRGAWSGADRCFHFALDGVRAYVCDPDVGLHVLDVTRPESMKETNLIPQLDFPYRAAAWGDRVLVNQHNQLYAVVDPSVVYAPPEPVFSLDNGETHFFLQAAKGRLYDVCRRGLCLIDVATTSSPRFLGSIEYPADADPGDFEVVGNLVYAAVSNGLLVIDVSDPRNPAVLSVTPVPVDAGDVAVRGRWVYVAISGWQVEDGRVVLIDAHDPAAPFVVTTLNLPYRVDRVAVMGDIVVAGTEDGRIFTLSSMLPSDDTPPTILGEVDTDQSLTNDLVVSGNLAYTIGTFGVRVVDCADPTAPRLLDDWYSGDSGFQLAIDGDRLYAGTHNLGVVIFDVSRQQLDLVGNAPSADYVEGLAVDASRLYVGQYNGKIEALPKQCGAPAPTPRPPRPSLAGASLAVSGNGAPVAIRLRLSSPQRGSVGIYDLRGRRVASLATGVLPGGEQVLTWSGRDVAGRVSAAGVYVLRLDTGGGSLSRSFALLH